MIKILVALLLTLGTLPNATALISTAVVTSRWTNVAVGVDGAAVYADSTTIILSGETAKMWSLGDFPSVQKHAKDEYLSMKFWVEYDCKNKQIRQLSLAAFSKNMGAGDAVYAEGEHFGDWSLVQPESIHEALWKIACGRL
jgi:hypothetical protein